MRVSDIQVGQIAVVELKPADDDSFGTGFPLRSEASIYWVEAADEILMRVGDQIWPVTGADDRNQEIVSDLIERGLQRLCWLAGAFPKQGEASRLVVQVHAFSMRYDSPDPIEIGVAENVVDHIREKYLRRDGPTIEVLKWLAENTLVDSSQPVRALISAGPRPSAGTLSSSFRIHGKRIAIDVTQDNDGGGYMATRVVSSRRQNNERRPIILIEGQFGFRDATVAGQFTGIGQTMLDSIVRQYDSYLAIWKEYNDLEQQGILRRARDFGWLRYKKRVPRPDGQWRFRVHLDEPSRRALERLRDGTDVDLEVAEQLPRELERDIYDEGDQDFGSILPQQRTRVFVGQCAGINEKQGTLDLRPLNPETEDEQPPGKGVIYIALTGDRVRLKRRESARNRIESASSPMPWLGLLLEGRPIPSGRRKRIRPREYKPKIRDLFDGEPTDRQMLALEVALNTPDVALIQGPPGTGKTRVIAALERILADNSKFEGVAGQTLLTSYQHDAVEHAASRTKVLGLPAVKVGRRSDQKETDDNLERWRREHIEKLRADLSQYPEPPASLVLRRVQDLAIGYAQNPGNPTETANLLYEIFDRTTGFIPPRLGDRLLELSRRLHHRQSSQVSEETEERELILRAVRALRTDTVTFSDDGPRTAYKLLKRLENKNLTTEVERGYLERAAAWDYEDDPDFLPELKALQDSLIDQLTAPPILDRIPLVNVDVEAVLTEVVEALNKHVRQSKYGVEVALYEYLDDLEYDPDGVRLTLQNYTAVLAATCQQSVSRPMEKIKGDDKFNFETVIVDEAARANPLDLFIPIARAERRIILVGDHRQLPHILEPDVERQLEFSEEDTRDKLSKSLFERLFNHAKELEQRDGMKRAITLDAQYRMHPVLGGFVGEAFYQPYGEGFSSPRPASEFAHDLDPYQGKVAAWVNIPSSAGKERRGKSKSRLVEAHWIAREASRILEQRPDFSVGVITFYTAQELQILREMQPLGLVEETEMGLQVARKYRETRSLDGHLIERLRVGTVDAFQGKEFDVVILSMTRSNSLPANDTISFRRKYGFLTLENRLCVAMSRQKRLLIVVGDAGMVLEPGADEAIHGLKVFYELCGGDCGLRRSP